MSKNIGFVWHLPASEWRQHVLIQNGSWSSRLCQNVSVSWVEGEHVWGGGVCHMIKKNPKHPVTWSLDEDLFTSGHTTQKNNNDNKKKQQPTDKMLCHVAKKATVSHVMTRWRRRLCTEPHRSFTHLDSMNIIYSNSTWHCDLWPLTSSSHWDLVLHGGQHRAQARVLIGQQPGGLVKLHHLSQLQDSTSSTANYRTIHIQQPITGQIKQPITGQHMFNSQSQHRFNNQSQDNTSSTAN